MPFFDFWLERSPRLNRAGLRALLYAAELAPRLLGFGGRLRALPEADRARVLEAIEHAGAPQVRQLTKLLKGVAFLSYYGDDADHAPAGLRRRRARAHRPRAARRGGPAVSATRPTTGAAYTDGRGAFRPSVERIERGSRIAGERAVRADVCVIGTGAGGAPVAKELAEGGMRVVMLEEGERFTTDDFNARPREMTARLYRDAGQTATVGNVPIVLPLGRGVGGTTLVNSGTCFRTPPPVLERWRERFGLEELTPGRARPLLPPRRARAERGPGAARAGRQQRPRGQARRRRARLVGRLPLPQRQGLRGLGRVRVRLPHRRAKQHVGITYVPRAWDAGATTFTGCTARKIVVEGGRARGVEARTSGGGKLNVQATTWWWPAARSTPRCCCAATASAGARASSARTSRSTRPRRCGR